MTDEDRATQRDGSKVLAGDERLTMTLHEETLQPRAHEVEIGRVRIHKRVEEVPTEMLVDVGHDDVTIERVAVDREVEQAPEPRQEGDTLVIPVVEEVIVTETRLVVREEIRITRRRVSEQMPVQATLRKERIEIEQFPRDEQDAAG